MHRGRHWIPNVQEMFILPIKCMYVFYMILSKNSDKQQ